MPVASDRPGGHKARRHRAVVRERGRLRDSAWIVHRLVSHLLVRQLALVVALASALAARAAAPAEFSGGFHARVVCCENAGQSYALFLPAHYDPARRWPVLFCFDPRARGELPVRLFAAAAEKHGFIVAGSHNSRNGPVRDNAAAARALLRDVARRFSVDAERVYLAGFSGGARVATLVADSGLARGVILCGGGFLDPDRTPERLGFDVCAYAGTEDFNRDEMRRIERDLEGTFVAHRLVVFSGGHSWLPESATDDALAWLDAQNRHAGIRARYRKFATALVRGQEAALATLPRPEADLVAAALSAEAEWWVAASALRDRKAQLASPLPQGAPVRDPRRRQAAELKAWTHAPEPAALVRSVVIAAQLRSCREALRALAENRADTSALRWARLAAAALPEAALLAYNHACVAALAGRADEAVALLRPLLGDGRLRAEDVAHEPAFAAVLATPEFRALSGPPQAP